jgi:Copper amine oxidase N-terminal domain
MPVFADSITNIQTPMPTFSSSNSSTQAKTTQDSNQEVFKELKERKEMLEKTIYSPDFQKLTLGEKIVLLENYFSVRADIYKESQKTILSETDISELYKLKDSLIKDSDRENEDNLLISKLIQDLKTKDVKSLKPEEIQSFKDKMKKLMMAYKDLREAGRDLYTLILTQIKTSNSNQITILNKLAQQLEIDGDKQEALELNKKMLKLTEGDIEIYKKVATLLSMEQKPFFFIDNEVVELSAPFLSKNGGAYIDVLEVAKIKGFEVIQAPDKLTIKNGQNVLEINQKDQTAFLNGTPIGKNVALLENQKWYLPVKSLFEMFRYEVKWEAELKATMIQKEVYPLNEIDKFTADELVQHIFPSPQIVKNN